MILGIFVKKKTALSDDSDIIRAIKNGDSNAVGILFEKYYVLILGLCLKYLKNKQEAEDVTMQIFDTLEKKILNHEINNFKSWFYTLSKNECLMHLRSHKKEPLSIEDTLLPDRNEEITGIEIKKLLEEKIDYLNKAIEQLKENQKICIELFYLKNKSYDEITTLTKLKLNDVKSHIQNGKRNLKIYLEQNQLFSA